MKLTKLKPNDVLQSDLDNNRLSLITFKKQEITYKLTYENKDNGMRLRLSIQVPNAPVHFDEDFFKSCQLRTFELDGKSIVKYMGYTTMKCRTITFSDADGDLFVLEGVV